MLQAMRIQFHPEGMPMFSDQPGVRRGGGRLWVCQLCALLRGPCLTRATAGWAEAQVSSRGVSLAPLPFCDPALTLFASLAALPACSFSALRSTATLPVGNPRAYPMGYPRYPLHKALYKAYKCAS